LVRAGSPCSVDGKKLGKIKSSVKAMAFAQRHSLGISFDAVGDKKWNDHVRPMIQSLVAERNINNSLLILSAVTNKKHDRSDPGTEKC